MIFPKHPGMAFFTGVQAGWQLYQHLCAHQRTSRPVIWAVGFKRWGRERLIEHLLNPVDDRARIRPADLPEQMQAEVSDLKITAIAYESAIIEIAEQNRSDSQRIAGILTWHKAVMQRSLRLICSKSRSVPFLIWLFCSSFI
jgi:hypothetical protein